MYWVKLPSGKRINLAMVFRVVPSTDADDKYVLRVHSSGDQVDWLYRDDIPVMLAALDDVSTHDGAGATPLCRRCNRPLGPDGHGDPIGGAHYACAVNEREMWGRR